MGELTAAPPVPEPVWAAPPQRVVIVDDDGTFGDLLGPSISARERLECVAVAHGIDAGVAVVGGHRPDLVVMDLQFSGDVRDGVDATALVLEASPGTRVVLLIPAADRAVVRRAAAAGAWSVMPTNASLPELLGALEAASSGGLVVHPALLTTLLIEPVRVPRQRPRPRLSGREGEVLDLLAAGLDARSVADQLHISVHTCRGYIKALLSKLQAHSQLEAVAVARGVGLLDAGPAPPH